MPFKTVIVRIRRSAIRAAMLAHLSDAILAEALESSLNSSARALVPEQRGKISIVPLHDLVSEAVHRLRSGVRIRPLEDPHV